MSTDLQEAPSGTLGTLAAEFVEQHKRLADAESEVKAIKARLDQIEPQLLEEMGGNGVQSMNTNGRTLYIRTDRFVNKAPEVSQIDVCAALVAQGLGHMVGTTFNAAKLKSQVVEWLNEGQELPADLAGMLKVTEATRVICRK